MRYNPFYTSLRRVHALRTALLTAALGLLLDGCATLPAVVKPPLEAEGEIYVYAEPFPRDAERLRFTIDRFVAVRSDGAEVPLSRVLGELDPGTMRRQRLLASGRVPPGRYVGLLLTFTQAALTGDGGDAALLTPTGPVRTDVSFEVHRRETVVLALSLRYAESIQSGFRFNPVLALTVPSRPVAGRTGYITDRDENHITVFDKKSGAVAAIITTGRGPESIAIDQRTGTAYAALSGEDAIDVLDVTAGSVINRIHLNVGDGPRELALTPDGRSLLAVNAESRTLSIIDLRAQAEQGRVPVGEGPRSVLIDRGKRRAYVFNELSNTITVIDIANRAVVSTLGTDAGPIGGQFNRGGDRLYVIHSRSPYLSIINPLTLSVMRRMFLGPGLSALKVDTVTDMLYVCRKHEAVVEMYDPFSLSPVASLPAVRGVSYMTIDGEENNLYLVSPEAKTVMTVNLISRKTTELDDAGEAPARVAVMGER